MAKITNHTGESLDFIKKGGRVKDGVPETVSIAGGATADLDVDPNDPKLRGYILAGAISAPASVTEKAEAAAAAPEARKPR